MAVQYGTIHWGWGGACRVAREWVCWLWPTQRHVTGWTEQWPCGGRSMQSTFPCSHSRQCDISVPQQGPLVSGSPAPCAAWWRSWGDGRGGGQAWVLPRLSHSAHAQPAPNTLNPKSHIWLMAKSMRRFTSVTFWLPRQAPQDLGAMGWGQAGIINTGALSNGWLVDAHRKHCTEHPPALPHLTWCRKCSRRGL